MTKIEKMLIKEFKFKTKKINDDIIGAHAGEYFLQKKLKHPFLKNLFITYESGSLFIYALDLEEGMAATLYKCKYSLKKLQDILLKFF
jgi:hypothetical protein